MLKYTLKRFLQMILVLFMIVTLVFCLMRMIGDPAKLLLPENGTMEDLEKLRHDLGLDLPLWQQYVKYLSDVVRFDFGKSIAYNKPVIDMVKEALPNTLKLVAVSTLFMIPLSMVLGALAAVKRKTGVDGIITSIAIAGRAMPSFWLGLLMILLFTVVLRWLPASGSGTWKHYIMPALTCGAGIAASNTRMTRSSMLNVLKQDFLTTARAKGASEARVVMGHAFRNSLLTQVTYLTVQVGKMLGGSTVIETVFAWPGMWRLMVTCLNNYDYTVVQACAFLMALTFTVINFLTDMLYSVIDPRIRVQD